MERQASFDGTKLALIIRKTIKFKIIRLVKKWYDMLSYTCLVFQTQYQHRN